MPTNSMSLAIDRDLMSPSQQSTCSTIDPDEQRPRLQQLLHTPTAQTLFLDGILSIFGYLSFRELVPAIHTCHYWYSCSFKERCRGIEFSLEEIQGQRNQFRKLLHIIDSPLRFHITTITHMYMCHLLTIKQLTGFINLHTCEFYLWGELPYLTNQFREWNSECTMITPDEFTSSSFELPPSLRRLKIRLPYIYPLCDITRDLCQSLIHRLHGSCITHFEFHANYGDHHFDLSPIGHLCSQLTSLRLDLWTPLTKEDQRLLASLSLTELFFCGPSAPDWAILHPDSSLILSIRTWSWFDISHIRGRNTTQKNKKKDSRNHVLHLSHHPPPNLTHIEHSVTNDQSVIDFTRFPQLSQLTLSVNDGPVYEATIDKYVPILSRCLSIRHLILNRASHSERYHSCTDDQLCRLLVALKNTLQILELDGNSLKSISQALGHLPPVTHITRMDFHSFESFLSALSQSTRAAKMTIDVLIVNNDSTTFPFNESEFQTVRQQHLSPTMQPGFTFELKKVWGQTDNQRFKFIYINSIDPSTIPRTKSLDKPMSVQLLSKDVPAERLVGIETNPGPVVTPITTPTPTAQTLFLDGILSIYQYLTLTDLIPALHSCHYWYSCGLKERCREIEYTFKSPPFTVNELSGLLRSPFKFHISSLPLLSFHHHLSDLPELQLPNLKHIGCAFTQSSPVTVPQTVSHTHQPPWTFMLPASLVSLHIGYYRTYPAEIVQTVLNAITACPQLTQFDFLCYGGIGDSSHRFDLSSLVQLPNLRDGYFQFTHYFTPEDQALCAQLPFKILYCSQLKKPDWAIFHPSTPLMQNIEELNWRDWSPTEDDWNHLTLHPPPHLHTLTLTIRPPSLISLSGLSNLRLKRLILDHDDSTTRLDLDYSPFIPHLQLLGHSLTHLSVDGGFFTDVQLNQILISLVELVSLELTGNPTRSILDRSLRVLPPTTNIHRLLVSSVFAFLSSLSTTTTGITPHPPLSHSSHSLVRTVTIDHMDFAPSWYWNTGHLYGTRTIPILDLLCQDVFRQQQQWAVTQELRLVIRKIGNVNINFNYHSGSVQSTTGDQLTNISNVTPPPQRLVGIETNPGPVVTTTTPISPTAQTLFVDGVLSIYQYLTLSELIPALHSCRYWYECGLKERCRQINFSLVEPKQLEKVQFGKLLGLCDSPLKYHIIAINRLSMCHLLTIKQLIGFPNLHTCDFTFNEPLTALMDKFRQWNPTVAASINSNEFPSTFQLPPSLQKLKIEFFGSPCSMTMNLSQGLINSIARSSLTEFDFSTWFVHPIDFSPCSQAPQLLTLRLDLNAPLNERDQQLLASLSLTTLELSANSPPDWTIFHSESPLILSIRDWSWYDRSSSMSGTHMLHLSLHPPLRISHLTHWLHPQLDVIDFNLFNQLTHLSLYKQDDIPIDQQSLYVVILSRCHSLTHLSLQSISIFTDAQLCQILIALKDTLWSFEFDEWSKVCDHEPSISEALCHLPPVTTLRLIRLLPFDTFLKLLSKSTLKTQRVSVTTVLLSRDDPHFPKDENDFQLSCQRYLESTMLPGFRLELESFNFVYVNKPVVTMTSRVDEAQNDSTISRDRRYSKESVDAVPASRLVGIETNPGPVVTTSTALSPTATAQTLFVDGVLSIFSFLSLSDVVSAYQSCYYWFECGLREKSRQIELDLSSLPGSSPPHDHLGSKDLSIFKSPFSYHITSLSNVSIRQVFLLHGTPQLHHIKKLSVHFTPKNCTLESYESNHPSYSMVTLPPAFISLTSLRITVHPQCMAASLIQSFINSLAKSGAPITQFKFDNQFKAHFFFSMLRIPTLTHLELISPRGLVTCEDQSVFANLPLRRLFCRCQGLGSPDWRIYHQQSPLMRNIEELEWYQWNPTDFEDWDHLAQYPPPHLRTLHIHPCQLRAFSRLSVLQPALTSVIIGQLPRGHRFELDDKFINSFSQCQSLKRLTCDPAVFRDEHMSQLLISFKNLNQLVLTTDPNSRQYIQAWDHLPPHTIFHTFKWSDLRTLLSRISHANRCSTITIHGLFSRKKDFPIDSIPTTPGHFHHALRQLCEEHIRTLTQPFQLEIKRAGSTPINFTCHHVGRSNEPPQPPLIGIEPNPGPSNDLTPMRLTSTAKSHLTRYQQVAGATLFADGLHIVHSYLTDHEFFQVLHVSRHWSHCCGTDPSRQMEYYSSWVKDSSEHIKRESRLNYHFTRLEPPRKSPARLFLSELIQFIRILPYLITIDVVIMKRSSDVSSVDSIPWPPKLQSLACNFQGRDYPNLVRSICQLSSLTSLSLSSLGSRCVGFDLSDSLRPLTQLTSLAISQCESSLDPLQFMTVPTIFFPPTLNQLSIYSSGDHFLDALPRMLNLRQVRKLVMPYFNLRTNDLQLIHSHMPDLERLDGVQLCDDDSHDIALFDRLESIQFPEYNLSTAAIHRFIDAMGQLSRLTHLQLKMNSLPTEEHWTHVHRLLVHLTSLQIVSFKSMDSSNSLTYLTLFADRLKRLTISSRFIDLSDLGIMSTLYLLEYLSLSTYLTSETQVHEWKEYFHSTQVLPQLQELHLRSASFEFNWAQSKSINIWSYRLKSQSNNDITVTPPAQPLLGIETNPGPVGQFNEGGDATIMTSTDNLIVRTHQRVLAATLFADGLHIIYSFLTDHEFFQILHVSRHWSHCCSSGPSRKMEYYTSWVKDNSEHITRESPINYHFTRFEFPYQIVSPLI